jgi:hypothetical protein
MSTWGDGNSGMVIGGVWLAITIIVVLAVSVAGAHS